MHILFSFALVSALWGVVGSVQAHEPFNMYDEAKPTYTTQSCGGVTTSGYDVRLKGVWYEIKVTLYRGNPVARLSFQDPYRLVAVGEYTDQDWRDHSVNIDPDQYIHEVLVKKGAKNTQLEACKKAKRYRSMNTIQKASGN